MARKKMKVTQYNTFPRAKTSSIRHYERMIEWVERTQNPDHYPTKSVMERELGETWTNAYCAMCQYSEYYFLKYAKNDYVCEFCPVNRKSQLGCLDTPWKELNLACTWRDWVISAKEELEFLKKLEG